MLMPSAQKTTRRSGSIPMSKKNAARTTVNSSTTSHRPRVHRNRESSERVLPRSRRRNAPRPAQNMNTGAQKCVIQRVMKIAAVVCRRSSGWNAIAAECTKSRVWSSAMMTMTRPRRTSTACTRGRLAASDPAAGRSGVGPACRKARAGAVCGSPIMAVAVGCQVAYSGQRIGARSNLHAIDQSISQAGRLTSRTAAALRTAAASRPATPARPGGRGTIDRRTVPARGRSARRRTRPWAAGRSTTGVFARVAYTASLPAIVAACGLAAPGSIRWSRAGKRARRD
jgi:hypothetical protein